ncbi:tRNA pseudouridine(38-40) synthase TruA [Maribacter halichondriae]|uniref:tRNA pseudouridine(38-40) synthase TruA n=1 Tax=Maribacter halichondriae TaxID=2980554 RepID=UPI00235A2B58|nr:tRNA pseudouridine(38-40) synthase TruA [Maribacter sp. Hal144]
MKQERHHYVFQIQFLGFRYSGWQQQPGQKTIEGMLVKTLTFILPGRKFKILGAGRTDAKVSALQAAFELFLEGQPIEDDVSFTAIFNANLPPDIKVIKMYQVDESFNIIHDSKSKQYVYLFSFGQKNHPFCAPFLANILDNLDIELMTEAAKMFVGTHDFSLYTASIQEHIKVIRTIHSCKICNNDFISASFFPELTYAFVIEGEGFMRYQVRMMMGALIQLGKGILSIEDIRRSLIPDLSMKLEYIAPASGLLLHRLDFK